MHEWKSKFIGVENMTIAVMGCIVNGPGESKYANIGIIISISKALIDIISIIYEYHSRFAAISP